MLKQPQANRQTKLNRMDGELQLSFTKKGALTRLSRSHHSAPLKASKALYLDETGTASVYLMETSGGMVAGDANNYLISVDNGSRVSLIPQSATKVYPSKQNLACRQSITITLGDDSKLTWQPETIIPFKDSVFLGHTAIKLKSSSSLVFSEIFSSGRGKSAENFAFESFSSKTLISIDDQLIVFDHLNFKKQDSFSQLGMFEACTYMGTIWFINRSAKELDFETLCFDFQKKDHRFGFTSIDEYGVHFRWLTDDLCLLKEQMKELIAIL